MEEQGEISEQTEPEKNQGPGIKENPILLDEPGDPNGDESRADPSVGLSEGELGRRMVTGMEVLRMQVEMSCARAESRTREAELEKVQRKGG